MVATRTETVPSILVVDDDATLAGVVTDYLEAAGMTVSRCGDGNTALAVLAKQEFDLIVLDLMLPHIDGLELFRRLRQRGDHTPVIMLTAKTGESDRILGLELGADDYVTKPFSPRELVLRIQSVLRRSGRAGNSTDQREEIVDGDLRLDLTARTAYLKEQPLELTLREYDLLAFFMSHPRQVFSRDELMSAVWGWQYGDSSTVTVHVRRVREKIEKELSNPSRLVTVWGRGYRWENQ